MKSLPLLLSLAVVAGCGSDEPQTPDENPGGTELQQPVEPEAPKVDPLEEARARLDLGDPAAAIPALESALAAAPSDASLWYELELAALGSGQPGDLLDRLSVTEAIGGQDVLHHSLRATLALAADRPADATDAVQALRASSPESAAAFMAQARAHGVPFEGVDLDPAVPADALVLLAGEKDKRKIAKLLEAAAGVPGWRAAAVRAEARLRLEDREAATAEVEKIASADDPRAAAVALDLQLRTTDDPSARAQLTVEGAAAALKVHDGLRAQALLETGVDLLMRAGEVDKAYEATLATVTALPESGGPALDRAQELELDAGLAAGKVVESIELGTKALPEGAEGDHAAAMARGLARAGWRVCDDQALTLAAGSLPTEEASWAAGMQALCDGDPLAAREKLQAKGGSGPLALDAALARSWAWQGQPEAIAAGKDAVTAADTLGWRAARIEARLTLERQARLQGQTSVAAKALTELDEGASPALQAELYARRLAAGASATAPAAFTDEPALVSSWRALTVPASEAAPAGPATEETTGMAAWAEARQALAAGDTTNASAAYRRAVTHVGVHRQGHWAPPLALDGVDGPDLDTDVRLSVAQIGRGGEDNLLALHEFAHYRAFRRLAANVGFDWTLAMQPDEAEAFKQAFATEQARSVLWLAGTAEFPTAAREATRAALPEQPCFSGMAQPMTVAELREAYPDVAVFSLRLGDDTGELLLVTPSNVVTKSFDDPDKLRRAAQGYLSALHKGPAFGGTATDPRAGDQFRHAVIDGVVGELVGIARYLVVAEPSILRLPWSVLPEQMEGRRYLADIRTVAAMPYLGTPPTPASPPTGGYKPDFLGLCREELPELQNMSDEELAITDDVTRTMLEAGLRPQGETSSIGRLFGGGYSVVLQGDEATKVSFEGTPTDGSAPAKQEAPAKDPVSADDGETPVNKKGGFAKARYVHLTGIPADPAGGFVWADGSTTLPVLACSATSAKVVTISTGPSPEIQLVRAQMLREAGAGGVLTAMWDVPPILRSRYLTSVYDALNREHSPARALAEARESLATADPAGDSNQSDPSYWGAFLYLGAP